MKKQAIAVDLDGTIAEHEEGQEHIGAPIQPMLNQVRKWVKEGKDVRIFTARLAFPGEFPKIKAWLRAHGLDHLPVTDRKQADVSHFYDDRAVHVERNTGKITGDGPHQKSWEDDAREAMK